MSKDRNALIRLASTMPKGSAERKAVLAGLQKKSSDGGLGHFLDLWWDELLNQLKGEFSGVSVSNAGSTSRTFGLSTDQTYPEAWARVELKELDNLGELEVSFGKVKNPKVLRRISLNPFSPSLQNASQIFKHFMKVREEGLI